MSSTIDLTMPSAVLFIAASLLPPRVSNPKFVLVVRGEYLFASNGVLKLEAHL
jgi:hypothetical protein